MLSVLQSHKLQQAKSNSTSALHNIAGVMTALHQKRRQKSLIDIGTLRITIPKVTAVLLSYFTSPLLLRTLRNTVSFTQTHTALLPSCSGHTSSQFTRCHGSEVNLLPHHFACTSAKLIFSGENHTALHRRIMSCQRNMSTATQDIPNDNGTAEKAKKHAQITSSKRFQSMIARRAEHAPEGRKRIYKPV